MYRRWKTACIAGGVALFVAAAIAATKPQSHAHHADGNRLVSGTVIDAKGAPVSGAVVTVSLWPDETAANGTVTPVRVASATTGADGTYDLASAATPAIAAAAANNGGFANFELDTTDQSIGLTSSWSFPAQFRKATKTRPGSWRSSSGVVTRKIVRLALNAPGVMRLKPRPSLGTSSSFSPAVSPPCSWAQVADLGIKPVVVGEVHSWTGQSDTFMYGTEADTNVQIGVTGSDGAWHVGGAIHIDNSSSWGSAGLTGITGRHADGRRVLAGFDVRRYQNTCTRQLKTVVSQWDGKDVYLGPVTNSDEDGACSHSANAYTFRPTQTGWRRWKNKATWFSSAVDLGPISVEAQSGYSTNVQSIWTFSPNGDRTLCGNDAPIDTASRVFAGA